MGAFVDQPEKHKMTVRKAFLDLIVGQIAERRAGGLDAQHRGARFGALDFNDQVLAAPDRHENALRVEHPGADPIRLAAAQAGPLEARRGIIIR